MNVLAAETIHDTGQSRWPKVLLQTTLLVALVLLYWPTWVELSDIWMVEAGPYSHAPIILAICLYYIYRNATGEAPSTGAGIHVLPAMLLVACGVFWFASRIMSILLFQALVLPVIFYLAMSTWRGWRGARSYAFPALYFLFLVPGWDYLTPLLQDLTIAVSTAVLGVLRIPAVIDGPFVALPYGTFEIAEGCAGLHFFNAALALGALYAWAYLRDRRLQLGLLAVITLMSVAMNWIRVTSIIVVGYLTEMQHYLVQVDHYFFGWLLFAGMMIPFYLVARKLEKIDNRLAAKPGATRSVSGSAPPSPRGANAILALLAMAFLPMTSYGIVRTGGSNETNALSLPQVLGEWRRIETSMSLWDGRFSGPADEVASRYSKGAAELTLYVNRYHGIEQGAELVNDSNRLFDKNRFREVGRESVDFDGADGRQGTVNLAELQSHNRERRVLAHWYYVGDRTSVGRFETKLLEGWGAVRGGANSGVVAVSVACGTTCEPAKRQIEQFLQANYVQLAEATTR